MTIENHSGEKLAARCGTHKEKSGGYSMEIHIYVETKTPNSSGSYRTRLGSVKWDDFPTRGKATGYARKWRRTLKHSMAREALLKSPLFIKAE
jgi:hypothetical protein